jgi:hypothetical protein
MATRSVCSTVHYLGAVGGRPSLRVDDPARSNLVVTSHVVEIQDARTANVPPSLDREGFVLLSHQTAVRNFQDRDELQTRYQAEILRLVKALTGAVEVQPTPGVFVRSAARTDEGRAAGARAPARFVHCDYTDASAWQYLQALVADPYQARKRYRRIAIYQTWRVLSQPPQDVPLAVCDRRTCSPSQYVAGDASIAYGGSRQSFEFSLSRYDPGHRWHYYSNMRPDELLVFKGYDFEVGAGPGVLHTAFDGPLARTREPRASVEARAFAFFD